jgi:hypothetical protein
MQAKAEKIQEKIEDKPDLQIEGKGKSNPEALPKEDTEADASQEYEQMLMDLGGTTDDQQDS